MMKVFLAGRAAEQVVFGRVTNGAANDLEKATGLARAMVFEYGMGDAVSLAHDARGQLLALRGDQAPARRRAGAADRRGVRRRRSGCSRSTALHLDRLAAALLEQETLNKEELDGLLADVEPESRAAETIGTVRALPRRSCRIASRRREARHPPPRRRRRGSGRGGLELRAPVRRRGRGP